MSSQRQGAPTPNGICASGPAGWKTTWGTTPFPHGAAPPAYVPYQKGLDDESASPPQGTTQSELPSQPAVDSSAAGLDKKGPSHSRSSSQGVGAANAPQRESSPSTPPPRASCPADKTSLEQMFRHTSPRTMADVSPPASRCESFSSARPMRTPSPVDMFLRASSNAPVAHGVSGANYQHFPASTSWMTVADRMQRPWGLAVPDKIPLEPVDASHVPAQSGRRRQSQCPPAELSSSPQETSAFTPHHKLDRIDEDGERWAAAKPKAVSKCTAPDSSTHPSPPTRKSSVNWQRPKHTKAKASHGGSKLSQGMPSPRLAQSREAKPAAESDSGGQPPRSPSLRKTGLHTGEPPKGLSAESAPVGGGSQPLVVDKEKWTKWFKSSRLSRN